ncbi:MAG TPA: hypothetical protein PKG60_04710 [Spirochaetota bacterium]|nr:hypothetical protein [Spirochaetota bacterium]HPS85731.1 hypothetical protein [Spirochaetota bacterium]
MKKIMQIISAGLIILAFVSCSSKSYEKEMKASEDLFYKGQYREAARLLLPNVNNAGKDELLFMMECGLMLHTSGDYETSNKVMLRAGKLAQLIPISVTQQAASFLTNDANSNYRGEDFEKVLVHVYLGINFLMLEKYDDARVEFMAVNNELSKIKTENGEARYKQNLMAKYLTAIAFEIVGERDNDTRDIEFAYIEYKQVYALNPELAMVKDDLLRVSKRLDYDDEYQEWKSKFGKSYNEDAESGELVTIFQAGRAPIKKSRGPLLKDPDMEPIIRVSLNSSINVNAGITAAAVLVAMSNAENPIPKFQKRSNKVDKVRVDAGGKTINTTKLEDVETTVVKNLEDDYGRLYKRVAVSIVTKAVASLAAGIAAKKMAEQFESTKAFSGLIGTAMGAGTGAALFSQMKPDLRCWHTLPANFQLGRMKLKQGKYKLNFAFMGDGGIVDRAEKEVEIKKGEKTLVNLRTLY